MSKKLSKKGAISVTSTLDRIASVIQEEFKTLGVPKKIADDFARRCDAISDRIEKMAGMDRQAGFDAATIGIGKAGPLEKDADESFMNGEFTQQENRELREDQESGKLGPNPVNGPQPPSPGKQASFARVGKQTVVNKLSSIGNDLTSAAIRMAEAKQVKLAHVLTKLAQAVMTAQVGILNDTVTASQSDKIMEALGYVMPHLAAVNPQTLPQIQKMVAMALRVAEEEGEDKEEEEEEAIAGKKAKKADDDDDESGDDDDEDESGDDDDEEEVEASKKSAHGFKLDA